MDSIALIRIGIYICSAVAVIFLVESLYLALAAPIARRRGINRRIRAMADNAAGEEVLLTLRAERGIFGDSLEWAGWLRRLLVQSGLKITMGRFLMLILVLSVSIFAGLKLTTVMPIYYCIAAATAGGIAVPLQTVKLIRSRRQAAFDNQLPDALDVIVRSLRSGHPVSVSLAMVGREMPDPAGTEFGIATDEMTYGLDMPRALRNLSDRVGVPDVSLLVTAVTLQSSAGGNLSEVLSNLSKVLRDRFQLRRKVKSLSAEGRYSAYGLTILPILIFLAIFLQNPRYYLDVANEPLFMPIMVGLAVWSLIGDLIMYKMINFKF